MTIVTGIELPKGHEKFCPVKESEGELCYDCKRYFEVQRELAGKYRAAQRKRNRDAQSSLDDLLVNDLHGRTDG